MQKNRGKNHPVDEDGFKTPSGSWFGRKWGPLCVAVKISNEAVQVRDTKDLGKTTLTFNHEEWKVFVDAVKKGEFNV